MHHIISYHSSDLTLIYHDAMLTTRQGMTRSSLISLSHLYRICQ